MSADSTAPPPPASVIHDLGYRGYDGPRLGRRAIVAALTWHSFRSSFGFGRSFKAKILPAIALGVLILPAVFNAVVMSQGQPRLTGYDTYADELRVFVMTIFVAVQAPEPVSRDLRGRVLPLYFSRPIRSWDYPLAKYLAFAAACLVMMEIPVLALYAGSVSNVHSGGAVWAQTRALVPGLLVGLMWAVALAAIGLFLASLTGRRGYATGMIAIFFLATFTVAEILIQAQAAVTHVQAVAPGNPPPLAPGLGEKIAGLFSPYTLMEGTRMWLGGRHPSLNVQAPGAFGAVYAVILIAVTAACLAGLAARYRKASVS